MINSKLKWNFILFLSAVVFHTTAQEKTDNSLSGALNLYLQCSSCDFSYIRENIQFVNYVRDKKEADVYLLITNQYTGSDGTKYELYFYGERRFEGKNDTLYCITSGDDTWDVKREKLLKTIIFGLAPYVSKTEIAGKLELDISFTESNDKVEDKWKSWVFSLSSHGYGSAEKSYYNLDLYTSISAEKVTPEWKIEFSLTNNYEEQKYSYETINFKSINRYNGLYNLIVKSLGDHWSLGYSAGMSNSDYRNIRFSHNINPAIEYNLFPYSESSRRQLRLLYKVGYDYNNYLDTTIYDKMKELLFQQNLSVAYKIIQKWGNINVSVSGANYFHDLSKNSVNIYSNLNLRIIKGLYFNVSGGYSWVHDQVGLPKGSATLEEILLQRKELETDYNFYMSLGLTYTFGSIYNNVVNPRFGS